MPADTRPLITVLPFAPFFWAALLWAFVPEWRLLRRDRRQGLAGPQDAGSMKIIIVAMQLALLLAFVLPFVSPAGRITHHRRFVFWAGVGLMVLASLLRRHCFRMLGDRFTAAVRVHAGQAVVERGAYRFVRHPSYTAGMLLYLGFGLGLTDWLSAAILVLASALTYGYRVSVEERALVATLGEPYLAYRGRTKRFVPFLF
jgi:protein-S-isoprenylcysteine O-methyltransferase Ste14